MATPTSEELQEFYQEETEYTTPQEQLEDDYVDIVEIGNSSDDDESAPDDEEDADDGDDDDE